MTWEELRKRAVDVANTGTCMVEPFIALAEEYEDKRDKRTTASVDADKLCDWARGEVARRGRLKHQGW